MQGNNKIAPPKQNSSDTLQKSQDNESQLPALNHNNKILSSGASTLNNKSSTPEIALLQGYSAQDQKTVFAEEELTDNSNTTTENAPALAAPPPGSGMPNTGTTGGNEGNNSKQSTQNNALDKNEDSLKEKLINSIYEYYFIPKDPLFNLSIKDLQDIKQTLHKFYSLQLPHNDDRFAGYQNIQELVYFINEENRQPTITYYCSVGTTLSITIMPGKSYNTTTLKINYENKENEEASFTVYDVNLRPPIEKKSLEKEGTTETKTIEAEVETPPEDTTSAEETPPIVESEDQSEETEDKELESNQKQTTTSDRDTATTTQEATHPKEEAPPENKETETSTHTSGGRQQTTKEEETGPPTEEKAPPKKKHVYKYPKEYRYREGDYSFGCCMFAGDNQLLMTVNRNSGNPQTAERGHYIGYNAEQKTGSFGTYVEKIRKAMTFYLQLKGVARLPKNNPLEGKSFGPKDKQLVIAYQKLRQMDVIDGIVGPGTLKDLDQALVAANITCDENGNPKLPDTEDSKLSDYLGKEINKKGRVTAKDGLQLLTKPNYADDRNKTGIIVPYGAEVTVIAESASHSPNYVYVRDKDGNVGWLQKPYVLTDVKEDSRMYHVKKDDTLEDIILSDPYYANEFQYETGNDRRTLVMAIFLANEGRRGVYIDESNYDPDAIKDFFDYGFSGNRKIYQILRVRTGHNIELPSVEQIEKWKDQGLIGTRSYYTNLAISGFRSVQGFGEGFVYGFGEAAAEFVTGLWDLVKSIFTGEILSQAVDMFNMLYEMGWEEVFELVGKLLNITKKAFMDAWNSPNPREKMFFFGKVWGYIIFELLALIATGSGALAGKLGKLGKINKIFAKMKKSGNKLRGKIGDKLDSYKKKYETKTPEGPHKADEALAPAAGKIDDATLKHLSHFPKVRNKLDHIQKNILGITKFDKFEKYLRTLPDDVLKKLENNPDLMDDFARKWDADPDFARAVQKGDVDRLNEVDATKRLPALRTAYVKEVEGLSKIASKMRAAGKSSEEIARTLHGLRRQIGVKYKSLTPNDKLEQIYQRNLKKYGDKLGPTIDYLRQQGKSWDDIIDSATRTGGKDLGF